MSTPQVELEFMVHGWMDHRLAVIGEPLSAKPLFAIVMASLNSTVKVITTLLTESEKDELLMHSAAMKIYTEESGKLMHKQMSGFGKEAIEFATKVGEQKQKLHVEWQHVYNLMNIIIIREHGKLANMSPEEFADRVRSTLKNGQ